VKSVSNKIDNVFEKWTSGLSEEEKRINVFNNIRSIPYCIVPGHFDPEKGPGLMLEENRGFCTPKHYFLGDLYGKLGIRVRYHTYAFLWKDTAASQNKELEALAEKLPITYHLACKAFIGTKWILLDATWDDELSRLGFSVNFAWDGLSNTALAVKPLEEFVHDTISEREKFFKEKTSAYTLSDKRNLTRFSSELNKWLENARKKLGVL